MTMMVETEPKQPDLTLDLLMSGYS